ncbi:hypothetical protein CEXT_323671 [Caerostris extrusa]|uniref:Uncharacterized protein n=1 Tax=Caerostris extrusa TaxID=172846 RepID=A0AAV4VFV6_CAEEX|nr:hypothetical protein CEXT_323671 [Caerostris extrusa]
MSQSPYLNPLKPFVLVQYLCKASKKIRCTSVTLVLQLNQKMLKPPTLYIRNPTGINLFQSAIKLLKWPTLKQSRCDDVGCHDNASSPSGEGPTILCGDRG